MLNSSPLQTDITKIRLTIAQTHKEFSSLVDNILAKFQQLDSGKFRAVSTPVFNAKATEYWKTDWSYELPSVNYWYAANAYTSSQAIPFYSALKGCHIRSNICAIGKTVLGLWGIAASLA